MIKTRQAPVEQPSHWTDDTAMALAILHVLHTHGKINRGALAKSLVATYHDRLDLCEPLPEWTGRL